MSQSPLNVRPSTLDVDNTATQENPEATNNDPEEEGEQPTIPNDHYVISFGPKTIRDI